MQTIDEIPSLTTEKENQLIQQVFGDNEGTLKTIRALFLGLQVNEEEQKAIKSLFTDAHLRAMMKRKFLPELDRDTPIGTVQDIWLGIETDIFGQPQNTIFQSIQYKDLSIGYTRMALALLENPNGPQPDISYDAKASDPSGLGIKLLARNMFIRHVEKQLLAIWIIANHKTADPKDVAERLGKDSSR